MLGLSAGAAGFTLARGGRAAAAMPTRRLGSTGVEVSLLGLGGAHLGKPRTAAEAVRIVHAALDHGVTFFDNCWDYHHGESERRLGEALARGRRQRAFVMTKVDGRTERAAAAQIDQSLARLRTDWIDLLQIHELDFADDPARVFADGGAIAALIGARKAGKIRFVGFTGHKSPTIHLSMLRTAEEHSFRFDAAQMPLNVMDAHYESFQRRVVPALVEKGMGVLGMKSLGDPFILESGVVSAPECLRYAMSLPTSVVITGCERMADLDQALGVALGFTPYTEAEMDALLSRTAAAAAHGRYEWYKTTHYFDTLVHHPEYLTTARE